MSLEVHAQIKETNPKCVKKILKIAKEVGLDCLDSNILYELLKVGAKTHNVSGIADRGVMIIGYPRLVGNEKDVGLYFVDGHCSSWYMTSIIKAVYKLKTCIKFETANSTYKLYPVRKKG